MRKMQRRIAFSSIFVLSLALLIIAMPYIMKMATKSSASADPEVGTISYYKADLFDYESSKRSSNGNFLLGEDQYNSDANLFLFGQENYNVDPAKYGQTMVPKPSEHNSWIRAYKYKVAQGLVKNTLNKDGSVCLANNRVAVSGNRGVTLFQTSDSYTYKGSYSFPFENIGNGYLQYDSSKNHVNVTKEQDADGLLKMERYDRTSNIGFMPFNKLDTSKDLDENGHYALSGSKNYYFGMKLELPFVMPKGGKITTYGGGEEDMIFTFTGDDDMWVFVDGILVLDLGGVHDIVSGTINFATGQVVTKGNHYDVATGRYNQLTSVVMVQNDIIKSLKVGRHTLQVYYLERGGFASNCKIKFRLQEDKTPEETVSPTDAVVGPTKLPENPKNNGIDTSVSVPNQSGVQTQGSNDKGTGYKEIESTTEKIVMPQATDTVKPSTSSGGVRLDGSVGEEQIKAEGYDNVQGTGSSPEVEREEIITSDKSNKGLSGNEFNSKGVAVDDKKNKSESKGTSIEDEDTPLGFLPKTGTIPEVAFYIVGAFLIVVALVMVVVTVRKKD